mmetsp:Transcript_10546/g.24981  ORF Transcript_10546/g.24981 Transcript_10546/m.24981 type:complete len:257 (+) Transcript_10546:136-906(+)
MWRRGTATRCARSGMASTGMCSPWRASASACWSEAPSRVPRSPAAPRWPLAAWRSGTAARGTSSGAVWPGPCPCLRWMKTASTPRGSSRTSVACAAATSPCGTLSWAGGPLGRGWRAAGCRRWSCRATTSMWAAASRRLAAAQPQASRAGMGSDGRRWGASAGACTRWRRLASTSMPAASSRRPAGAPQATWRGSTLESGCRSGEGSTGRCSRCRRSAGACGWGERSPKLGSRRAGRRSVRRTRSGGAWRSRCSSP